MQTEGLNATEAECAVGRTAPRVSLRDIEAKIAYEMYFTLGSAIDAFVERGDVVPDIPVELSGIDQFTVCLLGLDNGFIVLGKSAPASAENFDPILGQKLAYEDAIRHLWPLMGFALRERLSNPYAPYAVNDAALRHAATSDHQRRLDEQYAQQQQAFTRTSASLDPEEMVAENFARATGQPSAVAWDPERGRWADDIDQEETEHGGEG